MLCALLRLLGHRNENKPLVPLVCADHIFHVSDLLQMVRTWLRAGVEVHTCDIGKIESELDIVLVIKGWQGSDERKKTGASR